MQIKQVFIQKICTHRNLQLGHCSLRSLLISSCKSLACVAGDAKKTREGNKTVSGCYYFFFPLLAHPRSAPSLAPLPAGSLARLLHLEKETFATEVMWESICKRVKDRLENVCLVLHYASILRGIFASLVRANERVQVHNEKISL